MGLRGADVFAFAMTTIVALLRQSRRHLEEIHHLIRHFPAALFHQNVTTHPYGDRGASAIFLADIHAFCRNSPQERSKSMTTTPPPTARTHPNGNRTTPELPHPGAKVVPW
jgi:hypothetical protein